MIILVTGSAGFIGSALSLRLLERGDEVLGLMHQPHAFSAAPGNSLDQEWVSDFACFLA